MTEFIGKVKSIRVDFEGTDKERVVLNTVKEGTNKLQTFWSYLPSTKWTKKVKANDVVRLDYYRGTAGFLKVKDCEIVNSREYTFKTGTDVISGTITSLCSVRGKNANSRYPICFSVKYGKGKKVAYCYAQQNIEKSRWFEKNNKVSLEVIPLSVEDGHLQFEVINIWAD